MVPGQQPAEPAAVLPMLASCHPRCSQVGGVKAATQAGAVAPGWCASPFTLHFKRRVAGLLLLPICAGLSLAELVDPQVMQLPTPQQHYRKPAASTVAPWAPVAAPVVQQPAASTVDSGMLDLAAFGMGATPAAAEAQPAASNLDSGMLDLSAFGMAPPPAAEPVQQQPTASSLDSGMIDLSAFGMAPPPAAEPVQQQQPASSLDSGMLDLAAFGMAPPPAAPTQPSASSLDSGMLDLAAFGMASVPAAAPTAPAAAPAAPAAVPKQAPPQPASQQRRMQLPPPSSQALLPAHQLLPVAAQCCQQLRELLLPPSSSAGEGGDAAVISSAFDSAGPTAGQPANCTEFSATAVPGLSLAETSAVLAIAEAFSAGQAAGAASGSGASGAPVDAAAAHFVGALSLACACSSGSAQQASSSGGSAQQAQQAPTRVTIKNAAGVEYTLAPAAVSGADGAAAAASSSSSSSVGQQWGLLPGLDASAVLWALLSGAVRVCSNFRQPLQGAWFV